MLHQSEGKHAQIGQLIRNGPLLLSSAFIAYTASLIPHGTTTRRSRIT
jgi:hypothetical protein